MLFLILVVIFMSVCTLSITKLYIFWLDFVLSHSIGLELAYIDPFLANDHFLYPPGNTRKSKNFQCFQGLWNGNNGQKRLNQVYNSKMRTCLENFIFISMLLHATEWGRGWGLRKRGLKISWKLISRTELLMKS